MGNSWAWLGSVFKSSCKCSPSQKQVTASRPGPVCDLPRQSFAARLTVSLTAKPRGITANHGKQAKRGREGANQTNFVSDQISCRDTKSVSGRSFAYGKQLPRVPVSLLRLSRTIRSLWWSTGRAAQEFRKIAWLFRKKSGLCSSLSGDKIRLKTPFFVCWVAVKQKP